MALLMWAHLMYFGRGSKGLASLIHQMRVIMWDVRFFVLILSLFVCSFAVAFRLLGIYDSVYHAFILCFNMMLGDVAYENVRGHVFAECLYLIFLLSVAIILLNSLIAFMEGSLEGAREKDHIAGVAAQAQFLSELEVNLLPFRKIAALFTIDKEEAYDSFLSPSAKLDEGGGAHSAYVGDIGSNVTKSVSGDPSERNEIVILVPESFGRPSLQRASNQGFIPRRKKKKLTEGGAASHEAMISRRATAIPEQRSSPQTPMAFTIETPMSSAAVPRSSAAVEESEAAMRRVEVVEKSLASLELKLDRLISMLASTQPAAAAAGSASSSVPGLRPSSSMERVASLAAAGGSPHVLHSPPSHIYFGNGGSAPGIDRHEDFEGSYSYFGGGDDPK